MVRILEITLLPLVWHAVAMVRRSVASRWALEAFPSNTAVWPVIGPAHTRVALHLAHRPAPSSCALRRLVGFPTSGLRLSTFLLGEKVIDR